MFGIDSHNYFYGKKRKLAKILHCFCFNSRSLTSLALHNTFALFYFGGPASPSDVCRSKLEGAWIMALASAPSPPTSTSNHPPMPYWPSLVQTSPSRGKHCWNKTDQEWKNGSIFSFTKSPPLKENNTWNKSCPLNHIKFALRSTLLVYVALILLTTWRL